MGRFIVQLLLGAVAAIAVVFTALKLFSGAQQKQKAELEKMAREKAELERQLDEARRAPPPPSAQHAFWVWLYSTGNLLGSALALGGLGLYFSGLIGNDWWFIVPALYLAGFLIAPRPRRKASPLSPEQANLHAALDELLRRGRQGLSGERLETFEKLILSLRDALPMLEKSAVGDRTAFTLRQTILDYLPATLDNYLRLPRAYRQMHKLKDGRTPRQVFVAQLNTLHDEVQSSLAALADNDTQQLLANERFLADRFSRPDSF